MIENYLFSILDNVVSNNTFVGTLPTTIDAKWNDMVLIDCSNSVYDMDAMGKTTVLIWLYAKPNSMGTKNVATMAQLETKLNEVVQNANDQNYQINRRFTYQDFDNNRKWHCNIVELNLQIF
jgi:hypothetical protein